MGELRPFVFVHIEKCAGTSFNRFLSMGYPLLLPLSTGPKYGYDLSDKSLTRLYSIIGNRRIAVGGHNIFPEGIFKAPNREEVYLYTILRDPIDRFMSHYNYQNRVMGKGWSLREFCEEVSFQNFQVKRIAGTEDLKKAKIILESEFDGFGILEYFQESLLLLNDDFGGALGSRLFHVNERTSGAGNFENILSKEDRTMVMECNKLDIEFYQFAKSLFLSKATNSPTKIGSYSKVDSNLFYSMYRFKYWMEIQLAKIIQLVFL